MVPLLTRIERQLAETSDPSRQGELWAEKACYLARTGDFEGAGRIVGELKEHHIKTGDAKVSAYIMLAEGLGEFFASVSHHAFDRVSRAYALSHASEDIALEQLAASWLAHIEFNRMNYRSMGAMMQVVFGTHAPPHANANLRASIVIADAYLTCGQFGPARKWYERARRIAVDEGDQCAIASIIYNRAVLTINQLTLRSCIEPVVEATASAAFMEISSAESFHLATGQGALFQLIEVAKARCLLLLKDFAAASIIYQRIVQKPDAASFGYTSESQLIQLELAISLYELGHVEEAKNTFLRLDLPQVEMMAVDDQFIFWHYHHVVAKAIGGPQELSQEQQMVRFAQLERRNHHLADVLMGLALPSPLA